MTDYINLNYENIDEEIEEEYNYVEETPINYREEIINLFFSSMLDCIVDTWKTRDKDQITEKPVCQIPICSKSFKDLTAEDLQLPILDIQGSMVSLGKPVTESELQLLAETQSKTKQRKKKSKSKNLAAMESVHEVESEKVDSNVKLLPESKTTVTSSVEEKSDDWMVKPIEENVVIRFKNGNRYEGSIFKKYFHGKGTFIWSDGTKYEGDFQMGSATGQGIFRYSEMSWYEGSVLEGVRQGVGRLHVAGSGGVYGGEWHAGRRHGAGWMLYSPGCWYHGQWRQGLRHGQATRHYDSGATYVGCYNKGLRDGLGCMVWSNNDYYKGEWENGKRSGYGEYVWRSFFNKTLSFPIENRYKGTWVNGNMHGVGIMYFGLEGGARLAGLWRDNKKHGAGVVVCENGTTVESNPLFVHDKPVHVDSEGCLDLGDPLKSSTPTRPSTATAGAGGDAGSKDLASLDRDSLEDLVSPAKDVAASDEAISTTTINSLVTDSRTTMRAKSSLFMVLEQIKDGTRSDDLRKEIRANIELNKGKFPDMKYHFKSLHIPLQDPSQNIDVSCYVDSAVERHHRSSGNGAVANNSYLEYYIKSRISSLHQTESKQNTSTDKPATFKDLSNDSYNSHNISTSLNISIEDIPGYEKKCLRNTIILYLPQLRQIYDDYACVACLENLPFHPALVRMFLWQLYRDCKLPEKGISLIKSDKILEENSSSYVESTHSPFERIYFCQFLHSLISIAWELYLEVVEIDANDSICRKALTKFLEEDILPNARQYRGRAFFEYKDVFPLDAVYKLYYKCGEPHTVKDFLKNTCVIHKTTPPSKYLVPDTSEKDQIFFGINITTIDQRIEYLTEKEPTIQTKVAEKPIFSFDDNPYRKSLYIFSVLGSKKILKCISKVIPSIMDGDVVVNIDYPLSFLEFYEILLNCCDTLLEFEKKQRLIEAKKCAQDMFDLIEEAVFDTKVVNTSSNNNKKKRQSQLSSKRSRTSSLKIIK